jgi:arginyl-tRNA synthetase
MYATSDLACLKYRKENYNLNRIIYVTDDRQITHFRQVFRISDMLGWNIMKVHAWFGVMRFPEGIFSSRKGNVISLEDLLDEAKKRAADIIEEKNPGLSQEERDEAAEAIGTASVKYFDLSQNRISTLIFEWDKAINFDGNTAPYLMYTYARIRSIFRKASETGKGYKDSSRMIFTEKIERRLSLLLMQFPNVVIKAAENYTPNFIADYLFELAQNYNSFYNAFQILKENEPVMQSRMTLSDRTAFVIKTGLELLGIKTVERM